MNDHAITVLRASLAQTLVSAKQYRANEEHYMEERDRARATRRGYETKAAAIESAIIQLGGTVAVAA